VRDNFFYRPFGADSFTSRAAHGLRRGLNSNAASRLIFPNCAMSEIQQRKVTMQNKILLIAGGALLTISGYLWGAKNATVAYAGPTQPDYAATPTHGTVPKSYGRLAATIADQIGTGLIFEDTEGVIRFVSMTGMKEGELARYDQTPTHGGIPKSYGHLVSAVVNPEGTALVFEDSAGVIRFVTITGKTEGALIRN
jgi:hypothetical protein